MSEGFANGGFGESGDGFANGGFGESSPRANLGGPSDRQRSSSTHEPRGERGGEEPTRGRSVLGRTKPLPPKSAGRTVADDIAEMADKNWGEDPWSRAKVERFLRGEEAKGMRMVHERTGEAVPFPFTMGLLPASQQKIAPGVTAAEYFEKHRLRPLKWPQWPCIYTEGGTVGSSKRSRALQKKGHVPWRFGEVHADWLALEDLHWTTQSKLDDDYDGAPVNREMAARKEPIDGTATRAEQCSSLPRRIWGQGPPLRSPSHSSIPNNDTIHFFSSGRRAVPLDQWNRHSNPPLLSRSSSSTSYSTVYSMPKWTKWYRAHQNEKAAGRTSRRERTLRETGDEIRRLEAELELVGPGERGRDAAQCLAALYIKFGRNYRCVPNNGRAATREHFPEWERWVSIANSGAETTDNESEASGGGRLRSVIVVPNATGNGQKPGETSASSARPPANSGERSPRPSTSKASAPLPKSPATMAPPRARPTEQLAKVAELLGQVGEEMAKILEAEEKGTDGNEDLLSLPSDGEEVVPETPPPAAAMSRNRDENWGEGSGQLSFTPGSGGHYNARKIDEEEENRWATQDAWFTAPPRVPGPKKKKSWYR